MIKDDMHRPDDDCTGECDSCRYVNNCIASTSEESLKKIKKLKLKKEAKEFRGW